MDTVSQPQLSHSGSQKSIAASEGYYSASEHNSSLISTDSDERKRLYQTPTTRTPIQSHEQLQRQQNQAPVTSLRGVGIQRVQPQQPNVARLQGRPVSTITEERRSMDTRRRSTVDPPSQATTPGQDTTPLSGSQSTSLLAMKRSADLAFILRYGRLRRRTIL
jgi:hypothetical protein